MELHQLRYLVAVVDAGTVTAAAHHLQVAQSGVSSQLGKLERELGFALFRRAGRGVAITPDGEVIARAARQAVMAVDRVSEVAAHRRGVVSGTVRLGTVTSLTWPDVFDAIADLHHQHPGVDVQLSEGTSADLFDRVGQGRLDLAIAAWSGDLPAGLHSHIVVDDALVAVVAMDHPWAARSRIRPSELADVDLISLPIGTGARDALDATMARAGLRVTPRWQVSSPQSIALLAQRGLGVGIASASTASEWALSRVPISDDLARSVMGVIWRDTPSPAAARLLEDLIA